MAVARPTQWHGQQAKSVTLVERDGGGHFGNRFGVAELKLKSPRGSNASGQQCLAEAQMPTGRAQVHPLQLADQPVVAIKWRDPAAASDVSIDDGDKVDRALPLVGVKHRMIGWLQNGVDAAFQSVFAAPALNDLQDRRDIGGGEAAYNDLTVSRH
jgi:hypothetical protein